MCIFVYIIRQLNHKEVHLYDVNVLETLKAKPPVMSSLHETFCSFTGIKKNLNRSLASKSQYFGILTRSVCHSIILAISTTNENFQMIDLI